MPSYLAISYCWRDEERKSWSPIVEDAFAPWGICEPMVKALLGLRENAHEGVWIDNVCIKQKDEAEKVKAIGSMDIVYRAARRLVIILEDVKLSKDEQAVALKYKAILQRLELPDTGSKLYDLFKEQFHPSETEYQIIKDFLQKILSARWFGRAWCNHEVKILAARRENGPVMLLFASDMSILLLERRFLSIFVHYLAFKDHQKQRIWPMSREYDLFPPLGSSMTLKDIINRFLLMMAATEPSTSSVLTRLLEIFGSNCKEIRDRVSIAMNLNRMCLFFKGEVQTVDDCYWIFTALTISAGDMSPLRLQGPKLRLHAPQGLFSSWAQRPRMDETKLNSMDESSITAIEPAFIELDILLLNSVPKLPLKTSLEFAELIMSLFPPESEKTRTNPDVLEGFGASNETLAAKWITQWLQDFLAGSLDCGLDWIRNFTKVLEAQLLEECWVYGNKLSPPDPQFHEAALKMLSFFGVSIDDSRNSRELYLDPVTHFLTTITEDRIKGLLEIPRRIDTGANGMHAMTRRTWASLWFAVPVPLADATFFDNRAWLLEPYDPESYDTKSGESAAPGKIPWSSIDPREINESKLPPIDENSEFKGFDALKGQSPTAVVLEWMDKTPEERLKEGSDRDVLSYDGVDKRAQPNAKGLWRLMDKTMLIGCPTINPDGSIVQLLRKQRVYG